MVRGSTFIIICCDKVALELRFQNQRWEKMFHSTVPYYRIIGEPVMAVAIARVRNLGRLSYAAGLALQESLANKYVEGGHSQVDCPPFLML